MTSTVSSFLETIEKDSIIDLVPGLRQLMLEKGRLSVAEPGEAICQKGELLHRLCIPATGPLRLVDPAVGGGEARHIGYLQRGRSLCLREVIESKPASFSAIAESTTTIVSLPVVAFLELISRQPALGRHLKLMTSSPGWRSFKHFLTEKGVSNADIISLALLVAGDTAELDPETEISLDVPGLVFVDSGHVVVTRQDDAGVDGDGLDLGEGGWFGGEGLVPPHKYSYKAVTQSPSRIRRLTGPDLHEVMTKIGIVDLLYDEPLIPRQSVDRDALDDLSEVPGEPLSPEQCRSLKIKVDPSMLMACRSDSRSAAATIVNIAAIKRFPVSASNVANSIVLSGKVTLLGIADALEGFGILTTGIRSTYPHLKRQSLPTICRYGKRVVLLLAVGPSSVVLVDPGKGIIAVGREDFQARWDGLILEVMSAPTDIIAEASEEADAKTKAQGEAEQPGESGKMRETRKAFFKIVLAFRTLIANRIVMSLISLVVGLLAPKLNQYLIDEVLSLRDTTAIISLVAGMVLLNLSMMVVQIVSTLSTNYFTLSLDFNVTNLFYRHALGVSDFSSTKDDRVGDTAARLGESHTVTGFISSMPLAIATQVLQVVMYAGILFTYDTKLALIGLATLPLILGVRVAYRNRMKAIYDQTFELGKKNQSLITEQIASIATIKSAAAEELMCRRLEENGVQSAILGRRQAIEATIVDGIISVSMSVIQTAALWIGIKSAAGGNITIGEAVAVNSYVGMLIGPCIGLAHAFVSIEQFKVSLRRIAEKFGQRVDDTPSDSVVKQNLLLRGKIKLDRVGFRYNEESPWVLNDVGFTIYPNQIVAIVGRSGCGKTTLANIIGGNLVPTTGRLYFDDFDAANLTVRCRRRQIGMIMQESRLFAGSISSNIAFVDDDPNNERIAEVASQASAAGFINDFPTHYDYYLAEGGVGLSGGQKQRISIARTLYGGPRVLIMDEATSALDAESESAIMRNMKEIIKGRTAIIIAHRLSTVRHADRVIVLDEGRIVEDGTHAMLLKRNGFYAQLFESQINSGAA